MTDTLISAIIRGCVSVAPHEVVRHECLLSHFVRAIYGRSAVGTYIRYSYCIWVDSYMWCMVQHREVVMRVTLESEVHAIFQRARDALYIINRERGGGGRGLHCR